MKRIKHQDNGFSLPGIVLVLLVITTIGFLGTRVYSSGKKINSKTVISTSDKVAKVTFEGIISAKNDGCNMDDTCSITVDSKVVITGMGLQAKPEASIFGHTDLGLKVGDKVLVRASSGKYGLSLQACPDCYIVKKLSVQNGKPRLVIKTYCSDVCPQYTRVFQVYDGVSDQLSCEKIDGQTIKDVAWGGYIGCGVRLDGEPAVISM